MLQLQNLSKKFGSFRAVNTLNLQVNSGEFFGFLGPNGAGKTTTIKLICGLLAPSEGSILIDGFDIQKNPVEAKRIIGYIPDQPYLYDRLTGREFLFFSGGLYGIPASQLKSIIYDVTEMLKIGEWIDKRTEEYSQGMKQRVSIASALLHSPKFLLVDEPMVGLDPQSAKIVKEILTQKAQDGTAIIMSTHSLNVAEEICSRIGIIKDGSLIFDNDLNSFRNFYDKEYQNLESFFLELVK
jgi:ABC-2 type transport system ATP-binding protein